MTMLRPRTSGRIATAALALSLLSAPRAGGQAPPPPPDACPRVTDCAAGVALPTAVECEQIGDCACAQQIDCYVRNAVPESNWPLIPTGALHWNAFFWHTRYLQTLISPAGDAAFRADLDPSGAMQPLPAGTILYKQGFSPVLGEPGVPDPTNYDIFVATKLDGHYCPSGSAVGTSCQGGDWFWYHTDSATPQVDNSRLQGGGMFSGYGKPAKCVGCHNTAQRTDFLISLTIERRYPPPPD
jgi:hypothetical protein